MIPQKLSAAVIGTVCSIVALGSLCAQSDGEIKLEIVVAEQSTNPLVILFPTGSSSTNFLLQSSEDLIEWADVYHSYGTPKGPFPFGWIYERHHSESHSFWRALPGVRLEQRKQRWIENRPTEYTFRLSHLIDFWSGGVTGTVRVREGIIVGVTDATEWLTEEPIENPDLSRFTTISGIYEEIQREVEAGAEQVKVRYDEEDLYPTDVTVHGLVGTADDTARFDVRDLVILEP